MTTSSFRLPEKQEKAGYIQKNFDEIAERYDLFNDLFTFGMHRLWKRRTVRAIQAKQAAAALDLCCGSGDLAILMARANPLCEVVAADFSAGMLSVLEKRIRPTDLKDRIEIRQEDATALPAAFTDRFDAVTTGYGVRNVTDRHRCFEEIFRVLKRGGRYGILEVGSIRPKFLEPFAFFFMKHIIPRIGYLLQGGKHEMYEYLPHSAFAFPEPEEIVKELKQVGFQNVTFRRLFFGASILYVAVKP
ncbi:MAG: bifunctional demethylmenaquinone methyltransferase/2-methoxy-6-polyprenyl-1,4-benzoquinol methylase UbiE [Leptonema illini]|jgi:demethylmenaquinone methyltransferase/2-methoxy-6-polyprenyl-1,4-benzoquinol methylase|uniref:Demethylmenaquinone methyltransferase n=2 Tax=Leptonema illini TaxID=183 RepID=H2CLJ9_9LEPT|nr:bifunctional demethylmenaquinone methyltransferase/2-methoxy-6-polyprenyl-1,4-benzoquinol methylase UbiE [Leptonema illini]EHQ04610.1 demethylmenaquinone methyltransferase [Leptonema illini DSM 21528]KAB2932767.1 MAG: bifunctional demethylmenaquinone methyltransferase/2-methoxy-6-polyprenyl-1,4-benzoquinol methylase UbiE [Leptonema illini]